MTCKWLASDTSNSVRQSNKTNSTYRETQERRRMTERQREGWQEREIRTETERTTGLLGGFWLIEYRKKELPIVFSKGKYGFSGNDTFKGPTAWKCHFMRFSNMNSLDLYSAFFVRHSKRFFTVEGGDLTHHHQINTLIWVPLVCLWSRSS